MLSNYDASVQLCKENYLFLNYLKFPINQILFYTCVEFITIRFFGKGIYMYVSLNGNLNGLSAYLNGNGAKTSNDSVSVFLGKGLNNIVTHSQELAELEVQEPLEAAKSGTQASSNKEQDAIKKYENYAAIANDTRFDSPQEDTGDYKRIKNIENKENGFAACIYENPNNNEIVISYRCTSNQGGVKSDIQMVKDNIPEQYEDAIKLYDEIKKEYPDANVKVVGYSLGGSLAQLVAAAREETEAVAFDPYGTKGLIDSNDNLKDNNNCITYAMQGSAVSGSSLHPGETKTIKYGKEKQESVGGEIAARHSIENFLNLHDAEYIDENEQNACRIFGEKLSDVAKPILDKIPGAEDIISSCFFDA